jgi:hypothetical protein
VCGGLQLAPRTTASASVVRLELMTILELLSHPRVHAYTRNYFIADAPNPFLGAARPVLSPAFFLVHCGVAAGGGVADAVLASRAQRSSILQTRRQNHSFERLVRADVIWLTR